MALTEFGLITRYFEAPRFAVAPDCGVVLGIGDDAAILRPPPGQDLVVSIDTLVAGVHFPPAMAPEHIGHRALAVNLSDLAAMGAQPLWFTLALTLPEADADWLEGFSRGLAALAQRSGIALVGGDTTRGPLSITIQVHGCVAPGTALRRDGAQPGDDVHVSGVPGSAALGLQRVLAGHGPEDEQARIFLYPEPRIALGLRLRGIASAAIDVSDGLLADAGHIAARSRVRIVLASERLPLCAGCEAPVALQLCLAGGDDYELCFTASPLRRDAIAGIASALELRCTRIGEVLPGEGVDCDGYGAAHGYEHFGR
ncbi:MAG: thiamine-phosphate kinase [Pseudomonadales bacterium]|nr:thiamine-phosphate kinase [Pseudomonadales bacterium]